jgi:FtsP/CotA-like multicopper oxidase with cupredoxin domain
MFVALVASLVSVCCSVAAPPAVAWHDNLRPAGRQAADGLHLDLEIQRGMWHPNGAARTGTSVLAFAERGAAPTTPGPLLRVRFGTMITVSVHNTSTDTIAIHGLGSRRGMAAFDSLVLLPGASHTTQFVADVEGTFFYWGARPGETIRSRHFDDALLGGAFVVDPATGPVAPDRILLMDIIAERQLGDSGLEEAGEILTINGRPWPHTERFQHVVGDSVRWRIINASQRGHPMHLHGFYFRVDAAGDWQQDTLFDARERRMAVTENMAPGSTRTIVWSPDRPGEWLFHCHLSFHVMLNAPLGAEWRGGEAYFVAAAFGAPNEHADHHVEQHMGGLMLLTSVAPRGPDPVQRPAERTLRLEVLATADTNIMTRQYGYRLDDGTPADPDAALQPAPLLVFRRDQPTDVVIVNTTGEATSVHWHGIEIDAYSDGVVGVGGYAHMPTPPIMPGDSFVARITAPRNGSFMYHTHVSDINQQGKGLAGAIVVVDDPETYDAAHERVYLAHTVARANSEGFQTQTVLNRVRRELPADTMQAGERYRLRFMNLTLAGGGLQFRFASDRAPALWTTIAKDGFDLEPWQQRTSPDGRRVSIGETLDVLWTPLPNSSGWLELRGGGGNLIARQRIEVVGEAPAGGVDDS